MDLKIKIQNLSKLNNPKIFVTGIDTNIGKTMVSAILCKILNFDYWKPIQCGELNNLDSSFVKKISKKTYIHKESVLLKLPASPHLAAKKEKRTIDISDFKLPRTDNGLIIEGAGGIIVPINEKGLTVFDLIQHFSDGIILVTKNYLGSLNHTLLSIEKLRQGNVPIYGVIFNGERDYESEKIIKKMNPDISLWMQFPESKTPKNEKILMIKDIIN